MWDYVPHVSYLVGHVAESRGVINDRVVSIVWTRVPTISDLTRARNGHLSGSLMGDTWNDRNRPIIVVAHLSSITIVVFIEWMKSHYFGTVGSPSDERQKGSGITRSGPTYLTSIRQSRWSTSPSHRSNAWNVPELWIFIEQVAMVHQITPDRANETTLLT